MSRASESDRLAGIVERFGGRRVVVLGDLVVDEFVQGDIIRVSREAPVLILEHRETLVAPGGAGNAVANLRALGAVPIPVGIVGKDRAGRALLDHFRKLGVPVSGIRAIRGYETPTKSRVLAGGVHTRRQQIVRIDRGAKRGSLSRPTLRAIRSRLAAAVRRAEGLLVADYGHGAAPPALLRGVRWLRPARGRLPVTVDSRTRVHRFRGAWACTPNQEEVERALGLPALTTREAVARAGRALLAATGTDAVLVTRGAQGICLVERRRPTRHIPAHGSDEVADVTGAGDTVIAVFTLALLAGADFHRAAVLANIAAGLVVMKSGTATTTCAEMLAAIRGGVRAS